jgi:hypothetical protein
LTYGIKHGLELSVVAHLKSIEPLLKLLVTDKRSPQLNEGAHDCDVHLGGAFTSQDATTQEKPQASPKLPKGQPNISQLHVP